MRECLVTILSLLLLPPYVYGHHHHTHTNQQEIGLINQYLDIIGEEMDVIAWSIPLSELPTMSHPANHHHVVNVVSCLLSGTFPSPDHWGPSDILREFDLKLTAAGAQPTTSILKIIDVVYLDGPFPGAKLQNALPSLKLQNAWLSLNHHNHTRSSVISTIPRAWSPDCMSIASKRLDLYDSDTVEPEMDVIISFLSSHSVSIACRALRWYLRLKENTPIHGDTLYFIPFPVIFQKGLSMDENCESWLLLVELIARNWNSAPSEWRSHFVDTFFGYENSQANNQSSTHKYTQSTSVEDDKGDPDIRTQASAAQSDGLGWMEDVWATILQPLVIHINHPQTYWSELLGVMDTMCPEPTQLTEPDSATPLNPRVMQAEASEGAPSEDRAIIGPQTLEEHLRDLAHGVLGVLAQLLEAGTGLMPAELLNRLIDSPLLSDRRLHHDTSSLCCIRGILDQQALLILLGPVECF